MTVCGTPGWEVANPLQKAMQPGFRRYVTARLSRRRVTGRSREGQDSATRPCHRNVTEMSFLGNARSVSSRCRCNGPPNRPTPREKREVHIVLPVIALLLFGIVAAPASSAAQERVRLTGSGASFPFPIYSAWFKTFSGSHPGVAVDYQAKGSGAGIQDFTNRTVDFAASDAAMTDEQIAKVPGGVVLLPMTAGEIALAYNLPGVKDLKLP